MRENYGVNSSHYIALSMAAQVLAWTIERLQLQLKTTGNKGGSGPHTTKLRPMAKYGECPVKYYPIV